LLDRDFILATRSFVNDDGLQSIVIERDDSQTAMPSGNHRNPALAMRNSHPWDQRYPETSHCPTRNENLRTEILRMTDRPVPDERYNFPSEAQRLFPAQCALVEQGVAGIDKFPAFFELL